MPKLVKKDRGEIPGLSTTESAEVRVVRCRIREFENELVIIRQAAKFLGEDRLRVPRQKLLAVIGVSPTPG